MGSDNAKPKWKSEMISKEFVEETIAKVNNITTNVLFVQIMNIKLKFSLNHTRINAPFVTNIIKVEVFLPDKRNNNIISDNSNKIVHISLTNFISFADNLNGNKSLFYENRVFRRMKNNISKKSSENNNNNDDDNTCPICEERKVEIMLDCKHLFCEECIKTWLFDKNNSCPMCRFAINISNGNADSFTKEQWFVIDNNVNETYNKNNFDSLEFFIQKWFR